MTNPEIAVRVSYSKPLITELFWIYVRKKFFARTILSAVVISIVALAAVKELCSHRVGEGIAYSILALSVLVFTIMRYLQLYNQLANAYLLTEQAGVEFRFTGDKMSASVNLKQKEMAWLSINKIWVSRNLIVFVNRKATGLALSKQALSIEIKTHIADQLRNQKSPFATWKKAFPELWIDE